MLASWQLLLTSKALIRHTVVFVLIIEIHWIKKIGEETMQGLGWNWKRIQTKNALGLFESNIYTGRKPGIVGRYSKITRVRVLSWPLPLRTTVYFLRVTEVLSKFGHNWRKSTAT